MEPPGLIEEWLTLAHAQLPLPAGLNLVMAHRQHYLLPADEIKLAHAQFGPPVTLYPTDDTRVGSIAPNTPAGAYANLWVYPYRGSNDAHRTLLKFNLSAIPIDAVVTLATLRIYCLSETGVGIDNEVRSVDDDTWLEATATWNNQPDHGDVLDTVTKEEIVGGAWVEWDVTSFVAAEVAGDQVASFKVLSTPETETASVGTNYHSKEYDGYDPELYVEWTE